MSYLNHIEIERIKIQYYDPANPMSRLVFKDPNVCIRFDFAIVDNNADPDKMGRIKVRFPHWGDVITNWIPIVRPYASKEAGIWILPDVGTQVICAFFNDCASRPIVIGSVYTPRAHPPIEDNEGNNIKVFTTKSGSKIIFDDTDGEEKLLIHTKDGAMRLVLDKAKGLSIVNENGDIKIKCRKLIIEGKDDTFITMNKDLSITSENGSISKKAKSNFSIKAAKDVVFKAKSKINIKGNTGVTAGVQQMAKKDDQVVGIDLHDIQVPTNTGLMTVPMIPHPYLGKLADKLSQDVMINDQPAATKGSKSKYSTPGHVCMPPGVKFKKNPSNEGEVSSGTVANVEINGKEAAVLGSMVKTCNDPQDQETCAIIALGAPVILPIMMPGMDPDQFKKDGGTRFNTQVQITTKNKVAQWYKQPKLQNPEWSSNKAAVVEEVFLSVDLVDQYEYANVTFKVWEKDADREKDMPVAVLKGRNMDGKAEVVMRFQDPKRDADVDEISYFFTATSFRCEKVRSGSVTIEKSRPEYSELKWIFTDKDGNKEEVTELENNNMVRVSAKVNNLDDGDKIRLKIFETGYQHENEYVLMDIIEVKESRIEFDWKLHCNQQRLSKLTKEETLGYIFTCEAYNVRSEESETLEVVFCTDIDILIDPESLVPKDRYKLSSDDGEYSQEKEINDDKIKGDNKLTLHFDHLKCGVQYKLEFMPENQSQGILIFDNIPFIDIINY